MHTIANLISDVQPGCARQVGSLRITPLHAPNRSTKGVDYLLVADAVGNDLLELSEIGDEGVVAQLNASNHGDVAILIISGEELIGLKQNRIANTDVLLRGRGQVALPVSCVERGRWKHKPGRMVSGGYSPSSLRGSTSRSVADSMRRHRQPIADQHQVWRAVDELHDRLETESATDAMSDAFAQRAPDIESICSQFECPAEAVGLVAEVNGELLALDLFNSPQTLNTFWHRLITAHGIEALARKDQADTVATGDIDALLKRIGDAEWFDLPGVDAGVDWRFLDTELVGSALVYEDSILHLSAFTSPVSKDDEHVGPIVY